MAERATDGQRGTAEPQWRQIIQERYEDQDRIQGIFGYSLPATNPTHSTRRGWPIGTTRQGGGYLLPNGMWVLPNVDGTPFIDPITGHITSPRRLGARDATTLARRELESLVEPYQESGIGHFIGIPYGIASEILAVLDSLAALEEAIRVVELDEVKSFLVVLGQELARNPQLLNELPVEIVKSQLVDISNHFRQAVEDSNRTVDSSAHITRGFVKIIDLLEPLHAVFNTRVGRRIAERISRLREQLATTVRNAPLPVPGVGAGGLGVVPVKRGRTGRPSQPVGQGVSQLSRLRSLISQEEIDDVARILSALESTLTERARRHITVAVGIFEVDGIRRIGFSITRNKFARARRVTSLHMKARELGVDFIDAEPRVRTRNRAERAAHGAPEDAEQLFIEGAQTNSWTPIMVMPSRPACPGCAAVAEAESVFIVARNMATSGL